ncbi:histone-lysine N-trimethyltransferase SMYD5-like [Amia ocellicauda]|uniref:histone-lysine N-trimethyltransferase SMYD5-like n=1 Tax=Amia ocellicauda TaxID=2972642 RepID=UPI0034647C4C
MGVRSLRWTGFPHHSPESIPGLPQDRLGTKAEHWQSLFSQFCSRTANEEDEIAHKLLGEKFQGQLTLLWNQFTTALYDECLSNHSCLPNAEASFPDNNYLLHMTALSDIAPGEEISISYLDCCQRDWSRHSRHKILRYIESPETETEAPFTVSAATSLKGISVEAQLDVTSEEEEEEGKGEGETEGDDLEDEMTDV